MGDRSTMTSTTVSEERYCRGIFSAYSPGLIKTLTKVKGEKCFEGLRNVHLIETSPVLREKQRDRVRVTLSRYGGYQMPIHFHNSFVDLIKSTFLENQLTLGSHSLRHPLLLSLDFVSVLRFQSFHRHTPNV